MAEENVTTEDPPRRPGKAPYDQTALTRVAAIKQAALARGRTW